MPEPKTKDIRLSRWLKEKLIELNLGGQTKTALLSGLVELVAKSGKLKNKKTFLKALLWRERLGSTAIGNGVAIHHAKSKVVKGAVIAFAKSTQGIDFGALDGEKVYLFFILASPESAVGKHLKILAEIAHFIKDKFTIQLLKKAVNKKEILKIISAYENK